MNVEGTRRHTNRCVCILMVCTQSICRNLTYVRARLPSPQPFKMRPTQPAHPAPDECPPSSAPPPPPTPIDGRMPVHRCSRRLSLSHISEAHLRHRLAAQPVFARPPAGPRPSSSSSPASSSPLLAYCSASPQEHRAARRTSSSDLPASSAGNPAPLPAISLRHSRGVPLETMSNEKELTVQFA